MKTSDLSMLSCRESHLLQSLQHDRALTLAERSRLRMHLAVCVSCRRIDEQYRAIAAALKRLGP
ncbi:MAG: zf-HC2 domain-containing protein [Betaproteobacteria bacterium]